MKYIQLRLGDISVGLAIALRPGATLKTLVSATARSLGEVHNAEKRLRAARLLQPDARSVALEPLIRFIRHGVPFAYPPVVGPMTRGVATARFTILPGPGEPDTAEPAESEFVWPDANGATRGQAFAPPYPTAAKLIRQNPELRNLLSLLDLVRIGAAREQTAAADEIGRLISGTRP